MNMKCKSCNKQMKELKGIKDWYYCSKHNIVVLFNIDQGMRVYNVEELVSFFLQQYTNKDNEFSSIKVTYKYSGDIEEESGIVYEGVCNTIVSNEWYNPSTVGSE